MKVTVEKEVSERMGLDVKDISVILDSKRDAITVYGRLFPSESFKLPDEKTEPNILCTFHDDRKRILFAARAIEYMSFRLNRYSLFSLEVTEATEYLDLQNVSEIRLTPYYSCPEN